jgi:hypothetical protein
VREGACIGGATISLGLVTCVFVCAVTVSSAKYRAWGHEYVTTSLLENAVILETIKKEGTLRWRPPYLPSFTATRHVCLGGALARPCTILVGLNLLCQTKKPCSLSTTCGAILATTRWSKSSKHGVGEASRGVSLLSSANFIVPPARCRSAHVAIAVPNVSKWPQPSASKRPPPSEHLKLTRCANARANRRRKSKTLVQLSSSCRARESVLFIGTEFSILYTSMHSPA